ncbi:hypothetical protein, partial [Bacteroides sp. 51]|uniref:hypothetical protein n=1 Tax=Bacteroides sp. 51 TaxID=2302938 RepID=UPI0013D6EA95
MKKNFSESRRLKTSMSLLLLRIRERDTLLKRSRVAEATGMSQHTIGNMENRQKTSGKLLLRIFHYYIYLNLVTPA